MILPNIWNNKFMFQTTNQIYNYHPPNSNQISPQPPSHRHPLAPCPSDAPPGPHASPAVPAAAERSQPRSAPENLAETRPKPGEDVKFDKKKLRSLENISRYSPLMDINMGL
jgi:hypothetical protein